MPSTEGDGGPSIEFLLPFYGDPDYLREAVASIRAQSDPGWLLHILDDCYPDASVAADLAAGDERITLHRNAHNLGANLNYRQALEGARADYVVIMGADDRMLPDYLARLRRVIVDTGASVVQPGVRVIDEHGQPHLPLADRVKGWLRPRPRAPRTYSGQPVTASLLTGNWTYFPALAWRRDMIASIGFRPFHVVQDLALLVDVLTRGGSLAVDPLVTFEYRRHRASDSSLKATTGERFDEEADYLSRIADELADHGWRQASLAARLRLTSRAHSTLSRLRR